MAKSQNTLQNQIAEIRKQFKAMGVPDDVIEKQVKELTASMVEPVRKMVTDQLMKAATSVTESKDFQDNLEILKGSTMAVYIEVDRKGGITVRERTVTKRKRSTGGGSTGGSRPTLVGPDGKEHSSWAALCNAHGLNIGGDSAKRVWIRASESDPEKYPMPEIKPAS